MSIIAEIESKKEKILGIASKRECYFYNYLKGEALNYPNEEDLSEEEQIFYSAFSNDGPNKLELVKKYRQRKPIKGLFYNKNLLSLCAFAKYDINYEKNNLISYFYEHSSKEQYILSLLFPSICSLGEIDCKNSIDTIIKEIIINKNFEDWNKKIIDAIKSASDIIDIFISEQAFLVVTDFHPVKGIEGYLNMYKEIILKFCNFTETRYLKKWVFIIFIIFILLFTPVALILIKNWDIAEPIVYVVSIVLFVIVVMLIFYYLKSPDEMKFNILKRLRLKLIKRLYKKVGLDYEDIIKIKEK
jgi:hypothetical protein